MRIVFLFVSILILSSCTTVEPFDKYMRKGKDLLIEGKYEESIANFEYATIEKPTDEDAKLLLEQAKQKYQEQLLQEISFSYITDIEPILEKYTPILEKYGEFNLRDGEIFRYEHYKVVEDIEALINEANDISEKYYDIELLKPIHDNFIDSMKALIQNVSLRDTGILNLSRDTSSYEAYIDGLKALR